MPTYRFKLVLKGIASIEEMSEDDLDAIYGSHQDSTLMSKDGEAFAWFDREAPSLEAAIRSATADLWMAGYEVDEDKTQIEPPEELA